MIFLTDRKAKDELIHHKKLKVKIYSLTRTNPEQQKGLFAHQDPHTSPYSPPNLHSTFCLELRYLHMQVIWMLT